MKPSPAVPHAPAPGRAPVAAKSPVPFGSLGVAAGRTASMDAQSQRIMESIAQAQRAQAGILMASLSGDLSHAKSGTDKSDTDSDSNQSANPFRALSEKAPVGLMPQLPSQAMGQALRRYRHALGLQLQTVGSATARP